MNEKMKNESGIIAEKMGHKRWSDDLLGRGVLGDGLGTFRDGVLGQFTGQQQTDSGLNLTTGDSRTFVVVR